MNWFEEGAGPGLVEARGALGLLAMPDGLPRAFHVRSNSQERPLRFGQITAFPENHVRARARRKKKWCLNYQKRQVSSGPLPLSWHISAVHSLHCDK